MSTNADAWKTSISGINMKNYVINSEKRSCLEKKLNTAVLLLTDGIFNCFPLDLSANTCMLEGLWCM